MIDYGKFQKSLVNLFRSSVRIFDTKVVKILANHCQYHARIVALKAHIGTELAGVSLTLGDDFAITFASNAIEFLAPSRERFRRSYQLTHSVPSFFRAALRVFHTNAIVRLAREE